MTSNKEGFDSFANLTEEKLSELVKANDALDQEEARIINDDLEEEAKRRSEKKRFRRLRKSPLEIFNRSLLILFLVSFLTGGGN